MLGEIAKVQYSDYYYLSIEPIIKCDNDFLLLMRSKAFTRMTLQLELQRETVHLTKAR